MKITKLSFCLLLTTLICVTGCVTGRNPLQGWKGGQTAYRGCPFDKAICDDYRRYIASLSRDERNRVTDLGIEFYEDGRGQRAVTILISRNNRNRVHVLIYDANNKRIKVRKYTQSWYVS
jgi:hypothetical protein